MISVINNFLDIHKNLYDEKMALRLISDIFCVLKNSFIERRKLNDE
jgi:hypothetical protein